MKTPWHDWLHRLNRFRHLRILVSAVMFALSLQPAEAHRLSSAVLRLDLAEQRISGRLDIPIRDLAALVPIDANQDLAIDWGELKSAFPAIRAAVTNALVLSLDEHSTAWVCEGLQVADLAGETCASLALAAPGIHGIRRLELSYRLLFDVDPEHRGLLRLTRGGETTTHVFAPETAVLRLDLGDRSPPPPSFTHFVREGVHHIAIGFDHLLFLTALLLPAVILRRDPSCGWILAERFRPVAGEVLKVVTAFTLAHSLTLALATFDLVRLPSSLVETVIAASVALAALNNLVPFFRERSWAVAFGFGLVHGFGFASVLGDLNLPSGALAKGLLGFNLGVELGQLTLVAAVLPAVFLMRRSWFYRRVALPLGSTVILLLALTWVAERTTDSRWLPF